MSASEQALTGEGYAEYPVSSRSDSGMVALGKGGSDHGYADIEYAIFTDPGTRQLRVFESGVCRAAGGDYATGDKLRLSVEGGSVKYWKNGALLYGSKVAPSYPLNVDTSLYSAGATVAGARIGHEE